MLARNNQVLAIYPSIKQEIICIWEKKQSLFITKTQERVKKGVSNLVLAGRDRRGRMLSAGFASSSTVAGSPTPGDDSSSGGENPHFQSPTASSSRNTIHIFQKLSVGE